MKQRLVQRRNGTLKPKYRRLNSEDSTEKYQWGGSSDPTLAQGTRVGPQLYGFNFANSQNNMVTPGVNPMTLSPATPQQAQPMQPMQGMGLQATTPAVGQMTYGDNPANQVEPMQGKGISTAIEALGSIDVGSLIPKKLETPAGGGGGGGGGGLSASGAAAISSGITALTNIGTNIASSIIENNKDTSVNGFGFETIDPKYEKAAARVGGFAKGAAAGASIGGAAGTIIGPWGTVIGTAAGALGGGLAGLFASRARRKAQEKIDEYNKKYQKAFAGQVRNQDILAAQALMASKGIKTFKNGGKLLEKPGAVNIVTKGKLHKENNNLGNKDKGIPVVSADGKKEYELEKEELVLRREATLHIEDLVKQYDETKDDAVLEQLGEYVANELLNNTVDHSEKYKTTVKDEV